MTLPPFAGATRRLVLINLAIFFLQPILGYFAPATMGVVMGHLLLEPAAVLRGEIWQLVTYGFFPLGVLNMLLAMLTLWFTGSYLEAIFGGRWLLEFYLVCTAGGAVIASVITLTHIPSLLPDLVTYGPGPPILALLVAFAVYAGDQDIRFLFVITMKAKYLVAILLLFSLAILLKGGDRFGALTELSCAGVGYAYTKWAPRRGLRWSLSERFFALRNEYYRAKRRRAAKKFEVYMRKQNRVVHFDKDGRYVDPDEARRSSKDKTWMN